MQDDHGGFDTRFTLVDIISFPTSASPILLGQVKIGHGWHMHPILLPTIGQKWHGKCEMIKLVELPNGCKLQTSSVTVTLTGQGKSVIVSRYLFGVTHFGNMGFIYQYCHCKREVTITGVTITESVCTVYDYLPRQRPMP